MADTDAPELTCEAAEDLLLVAPESVGVSLQGSCKIGAHKTLL
jgi:hypothetical protein